MWKVEQYHDKYKSWLCVFVGGLSACNRVRTKRIRTGAPARIVRIPGEHES